MPGADLSIELLAGLVILALIDSTSFGTLLIPVWLLTAPDEPRQGRILLFLGTVAVLYFALGLALLGGLSGLADEVGAWMDRRPMRIAQLVVALGLMVAGLAIEPLTKAGKAKKAARRVARGPGRVQIWRRRVLDGSASPAGVVGLAMTATVAEAASMVPYLAALGMLTASSLTLAESGMVLVGYCLVMIGPALLLVAARTVLHDRTRPLLERIEGWMTRNAGEMTAWVLFLVGFYLAGDAVAALDMWAGM